MSDSRAVAPVRMRFTALLIAFLVLPLALPAQQPSAEQQTPPSGGVAPQSTAQPQTLPDEPKPVEPPKRPTVHRFWDQTNCWLFAGVLGARYLDFASTLNARRRGLDEALLNNETVDNHAEFAAIEFAGAATSVGVSYLFHRSGHHSLERWTSIVHIGVTVFGAGRNFLLKTPHPATTTTGP